MAIDLARLRSIARGEITPKNGVTGVAGVADVARYASKSPELRQLRPLRVKNTDGGNDVISGVAAALPRPLFDREGLQAEAERRNRQAIAAGETDRFCACGKLATVAVGSFPSSRLNPEGVAKWLCSECFGDRQRDGAAS